MNFMSRAQKPINAPGPDFAGRAGPAYVGHRLNNDEQCAITTCKS